MKGFKIFHNVRSFISAIAAIASAAALVSAIYFTQLDLQWTAFLAGILVAAVLAEATRLSRSERLVRRRTEQLLVLKNKLEQETQLRKRAEEAFAASKPRLHMLDEILPVMVAYIDNESRCRYHNRALRDWLHLRPEQINGRHMREFLGEQFFQNTADAARRSMSGTAVHDEWNQKMPDGVNYRLSVDYLPEFIEDGKIAGLYLLVTDNTARDEAPLPPLPEMADMAGTAAVPPTEEAADGEQFAESYSNQMAMPEDTGSLIMAAIEKNEFCLFSQRIVPLTKGGDAPEHHEILVRLKEEEESMMPPGAFFPLAEKYGLMPHLDRWVVQHVVEWISYQNPEAVQNKGAMYFINVSGATIGDPGFPAFLRHTLGEYGVPASALCFEIPNSELALRSAVVVEFAQRVRRLGCRAALSGFGEGKILFDLIRGFQVEFLKIDGSVILDILRDPVDLAKVTSINRVAKQIGVKTVAEFVESEEVIARLKEIGIDYAQGFGISRPQPLGK